MKSTRPGQLLRMKIRFTKQYVSEQLRGKVVEYRGKERGDKELLAASKEKRPLTDEVPGLGIMRLDPRHDSYQTTIKLQRRDVSVEIESDKPRALHTLGSRLLKLGISTSTFQTQLLDVLAGDLLPVWNESWREPKQKPLTASGLKKAVRLTGVIIASNGACEFLFEDGDLFGGHDLVVRGNLTSGPRQADLYG